MPQACCLTTILAMATLFTVGCASAKMTSTPSSPLVEGSLSASDSALNFGNVQVGNSKTMSLTLTNTDTQSATVEISKITVSGTGFNASGVTLPLTLTAGQSVTLNISFQPSSAGTANGNLSVACTATNSTVTVALAGTGLGSGQLAVNPASLNFSGVTVGSSQSLKGTLSAGSSSVTVSSASWNGTGFSVSGISFPVTISAGQNVSFTVTFTPQTAGAVSGTVSFISNATNAPTSESLAGTGVQSTQHSVTLTWNPDASTVQGYYVYRGAQSGGPYTRISTLQPGTSYTDATVASATTYYYVVTALGANSVESGHSNQVVAMIP